MDTGALIDGLLLFLAFVAFVALHEYAHAWTANRCGDDTPRLQGRLTLDPMAHIDWVGTIILPLILVLAAAAGGGQMLFGWGKPVQVNLNNFRVRRRDDILVSVAGPFMNLLIVLALFVLLKTLDWFHINSAEHAILAMARLSMFLCFFNLLPIPPLDGGHIARNLIGISDEAYAAISRYSFIFFILIMQSPAVGDFLSAVTNSALNLVAFPFGWRLGFS